MIKKVLITAGFILIAGSFAFSQKTNVELRLTLRDGNVVSGKTSMDKVVLGTDYGVLNIPVSNVNTIKVGLDINESDRKNVVLILKQLQNSNVEMRINAYEQLVKQNASAVLVINDFMADKNYQPPVYNEYTIESALKELLNIHGLSEEISSKDIVQLDYDYTIGGKYSFSKIDLKTEFGLLSIPKGKIDLIEVLFTGEVGDDKTFRLLAAKHISSNNSGGWLRTGVVLHQGQKFTINASGEVSFASLSGNKYKPDGTLITQQVLSDDYGYNTVNASAYPTYGNVVFKVGENGAVQKAGHSFSGTANNSGMLYISIYETVYNPANSGSYTVKISHK